jgi:CheY-like chemotaxis protein
VNRIALAVAILVAAPALRAQDPRVEPPRTPAEFWNAVEFELNTGKFDVAAQYLKAFLAANPTEQDYLAIEKERGMAAFLRLRTVIQWSADKPTDDEARKNAELVIEKATAALRKQLSDVARINRLIQNLRASPEERAFAVRELQRSGALAMPHLIAVMQADPDPAQRALLLDILPLLPQDTIAPLLAATDMRDPVLKLQLLQTLAVRQDRATLANRAETDPLPTLDYLAASPKESDQVRRKARDIAALLRATSPARLPIAKVALTQAAEKFYQHKANFINPSAVAIWRWETDHLTQYSATASQAEEYLGLRYARWALELDPSYQPAQAVFLSLAVEKAMERGGPDKSLSVTAPDVHDLLATVYPGALILTLDRALTEGRTAVGLGVVRALGERAEVSAARTERSRPGVLVRALDYPDRRVQIAAADALLRLPKNVHTAHARIIEVLRRALAADAETLLPRTQRILVCHFQPIVADLMAGAVRAAGYEAVVVNTGREAMRRLKEAADIDGVILDADLPYPPLPDTIASLRYDVHVGLLPVRIVYTPEIAPTTVIVNRAPLPPLTATAPPPAIQNELTARRLNRLIESYRQISVVPGPVTPLWVKREFGEETLAQPEPSASTPLTPEERKGYSILAIEWLKRLATGEVPGYDVRPAERAIRSALKVEELTKPAIEATARLTTRDAQSDLASIVLDAQRSPEVRVLAAEALVQNVRRIGVTLTTPQMQSLLDLLPTVQEPVLRAKVAAAVGAIQGTAEQSGLRMQRFAPALPKSEPPAAPEAPPVPPPPAEPAKNQ